MPGGKKSGGIPKYYGKSGGTYVGHNPKYDPTIPSPIARRTRSKAKAEEELSTLSKAQYKKQKREAKKTGNKKSKAKFASKRKRDDDEDCELDEIEIAVSEAVESMSDGFKVPRTKKEHDNFFVKFENGKFREVKKVKK